MSWSDAMWRASRGRRTLLAAAAVVVMTIASATSIRSAVRETQTGGTTRARTTVSGTPTPPSPSPAHARTLPPSGSNVYAAISPGDLSPRVAGVPERVYVPNSESGSVDVIDPATYKIVAHYRVGQYPQHVTPSWDLRHLYVDNTRTGSVTVLDPTTGRPVRTIPVPDPYNLYFTPDGSRAVVVAESYQRLDFRDPKTWKLIGSVHIPSAGPNHLDFSANGRFLIISTEFGGWVFRVSTVSMRVTGRLFVGGNPVDVKLSPNGRVFYVANQGLSGVSVIDPTHMRFLKFIHTGSGAHGFAVSRDTKHLYVSNRLAGSISVIDFATKRVVDTWKVGGSPDMMQVSPDGRQLWVSNRFNSSVSVIDTRTGRVLKTIRVGASPHGLCLFPQPGRYSLGHNGVYR